jgi:hypothetical protein
MSLLTVLLLLLAATAFGFAWWRARAVERARPMIFDERQASNGLYPDDRRQVKAVRSVSKTPPRARRR